jgi:hypothetical protein
LFEEDKKFSKEHPLNSEIDDIDIFIHGTSSKNFLKIQNTGFLLRSAMSRNFGISEKGVCFEKFYQHGKDLSVVDLVIDLTMKDYCDNACQGDGSSEGVVLQITGKELKQLGCPIYADWNTVFKRRFSSDWIPIGIETNGLLSIIIVDRDIPISCLEVMKKIPFKKD